MQILSSLLWSTLSGAHGVPPSFLQQLLRTFSLQGDSIPLPMYSDGDHRGKFACGDKLFMFCSLILSVIKLMFLILLWLNSLLAFPLFSFFSPYFFFSSYLSSYFFSLLFLLFLFFYKCLCLIKEYGVVLYKYEWERVSKKCLNIS